MHLGLRINLKRFLLLLLFLFLLLLLLLLLLLSYCNSARIFDFFTGSCQADLPFTTFVHFFKLITLISFRTSSCHLFLGRPLDFFPIGLHSAIFLTFLYSSILCKWPHHFNSWAFMDVSVLDPPINLFDSWLFLILHPSRSWKGPKLFFRILLSKIIKYFISLSVKVQDSTVI